MPGPFAAAGAKQFFRAADAFAACVVVTGLSGVASWALVKGMSGAFADQA